VVRGGVGEAHVVIPDGLEAASFVAAMTASAPR
jgi:hypothetical protein